MSRRSEWGFTLLELIVVITIIGILGTVVAIKVGSSTAVARQTTARYNLQAMYRAASMIQSQTGRWPRTLGELENPVHPDTGMILAGGLEQIPRDPWGNEFIYELHDVGPVVISLGRDGAPGGEGEDADIIYPLHEYAE